MLSISEVAGIVAVSVKQPHAEETWVLSAYLEKQTGWVAAARLLTSTCDPPAAHCDGKAYPEAPTFEVTVVVMFGA